MGVSAAEMRIQQALSNFSVIHRLIPLISQLPDMKPWPCMPIYSKTTRIDIESIWTRHIDGASISNRYQSEQSCHHGKNLLRLSAIRIYMMKGYYIHSTVLHTHSPTNSYNTECYSHIVIFNYPTKFNNIIFHIQIKFNYFLYNIKICCTKLARMWQNHECLHALGGDHLLHQ